MPTGQLYDNIAAITVVGEIAVLAIYILPTINFQNIQAIDEQQLLNIAQETLNYMLLSEGYPANWGSYYPFDEDSVQSFGLALAGAGRFYVLDADKVQRLVENNPVGYISYERVKELLGISGYGFSLSIKPPFKVYIINMSESFQHLIFEVFVSDFGGKPVPNAKVTATSIYCTGQVNNLEIHFKKTVNTTNAAGKCKIEQFIDENQIKDIATIFHVSLSGINTYTVVYQRIPPDNIAQINYVNNTIVLTQNGVPPSREEIKIKKILIYGPSGDVILEYNGTQHDVVTYWNGQGDPPPGYKIWSKEFPIENPELILFVFSATIPGEGRRPVIIVGPNPLWMGYRVLHYGDFPNGRVAVTVRRNVMISGMTYIAELTLWKEI
ncbi:hypothetical protein DRO54_02785 [Candidatus Bathyarchaeota archaeon]|nr:MAG: hypothetical protein DRO54_02785 [Candidatus Bathyarchaeota archaeon]